MKSQYRFPLISDSKIKLPNVLEMNAMKLPQSVPQKLISRRLSEAVAVAGIAALFAVSSSAFAAQTTGGVNWIDPLSYQKPQFIPITVPDEASVTNKAHIGF